LAETREGSFGSLAQEVLELAERHLDRIEVRRILGQETKRGPHILDCLSDA